MLLLALGAKRLRVMNVKSLLAKIFIAVSLTFLLTCDPAIAACKNPDGEEGKLIYNDGPHVPQFCDGEIWIALGAVLPSAGGSCTSPDRPEGTIIYNDGAQTPQFCNGTDWVSMVSYISQRCNAPPLCPNVGDVCDDGDAGNDPDPVYAGLLFYEDSTCKQVFVPQADQSDAAQWKTSTGTDDIATDSTEDGKINHSQIVASAGYVADPNTFPAFKLCEELSDGGFGDWYLPARTELDLVWRNKSAIGGFTTNYYWSSTEYGTSYAWYRNFNTGHMNDNTKTNNYDVRCVRTEPASFGIMHCTPPALCPNVGDVCDDGNSGNNPDPVFAGFMVYNSTNTCEPLYISQNTQSTGASWKTSTGTDDIANDSLDDGRSNQSQVVATADYIADPNNFPAFKLCEELAEGGYNDWYLPSRSETDMLYRNASDIGGFVDTNWTSTEGLWDNDVAWYCYMGNGYQGHGTKTGSQDVRCVRRD